jgi:hypothetical protein
MILQPFRLCLRNTPYVEIEKLKNFEKNSVFLFSSKVTVSLRLREGGGKLW